MRMPVTAKLSRRFYERFGDEITNELVDWLNSVDATYQTGLRELNETNFARFDAKLEQRIGEVASALGARIDILCGRMDLLFDEQRALSLRFAALESQVAASETRLLRWMITLWTGTILTVVGLVITVLLSR
jgi:hypothetical protein